MLTPKEPRIHGLKITYSTNHIVKKIIQMGPNLISLKPVKNVAIKLKLKFIKKRGGQKKVLICPTQLLKTYEAQFGSPGPLGIKLLILFHCRISRSCRKIKRWLGDHPRDKNSEMTRRSSKKTLPASPRDRATLSSLDSKSVVVASKRSILLKQ